MTDWKLKADELFAEHGRNFAKIRDIMMAEGFFKGYNAQEARYMIKSYLQDKPTLIARETDKPAKQPLTADDYIQTEKKALVERNEKRVIRELAQKAAITEIVIEKNRSATEALPRFNFEPIYPMFHRKMERSEEEVILDISDIQAGTKIVKDGTGGLNEFNWGIMEQEFTKLFLGVASISKRQMELAPIRKIHVFMLGDMVEGWDIYAGQAQNIDQDIYNQLYLLRDAMSRFLLQLLTVFEVVEVTTVYGNHGRVGKKGENPNWVNWDLIFYNSLMDRLANETRIQFNITMSWWQIKEVMGWRFLLFHGDDVKGWGGIPFYGIDRSQKNYREMLETVQEKFDYVEMGHLHTPAMLPLMGGGFVTINGCWPGGSVLALKNMATTGRPQQWIKGIHPEYGQTWHYPIYLNGRR